MKRLRTLSCSNPSAVDELNRKRGWGGAYWKWVNRRKYHEHQQRQMRPFTLLIPLCPVPGHEQLPGEQLPEQQPTKH